MVGTRPIELPSRRAGRERLAQLGLRARDPHRRLSLRGRREGPRALGERLVEGESSGARRRSASRWRSTVASSPRAIGPVSASAPRSAQFAAVRRTSGAEQLAGVLDAGPRQQLRRGLLERDQEVGGDRGGRVVGGPAPRPPRRAACRAGPQGHPVRGPGPGHLRTFANEDVLARPSMLLDQRVSGGWPGPGPIERDEPCRDRRGKHGASPTTRPPRSPPTSSSPSRSRPPSCSRRPAPRTPASCSARSSRTAANWSERGADALTGPIARGDEATVERHRARSREPAPELLDSTRRWPPAPTPPLGRGGKRR